MPEPQPRILFVHAHPDDESIGTGATMAKYAAEGAHVTLVTCTLGEEGDVVVDDLRHLAADQQNRLGEYRIGELEKACAALGVADHRFLGGAGHWRDSGMMGSATNDHPRSFWRADPGDAVAELLAVIREVRPDVVVSYAADGGYGHPDHIQAHRTAWAAFGRAGESSEPDGFSPTRFYATATPLSLLELAVGRGPFEQVSDVTQFGFGTPDAAVTTRIDATEYLPAKLAALRAHRTQLTVDGDFFALSNNIGQPVSGFEYFIRLAGVPGRTDADGYEHDLFA
jgi:N-acetyl-1-D-myo-inositol-2-amino-2-deoxy-alpha-D-glucopyranoside deacetylase